MTFNPLGPDYHDGYNSGKYGSYHGTSGQGLYEFQAGQDAAKKQADMMTNQHYGGSLPWPVAVIGIALSLLLANSVQSCVDENILHKDKRGKIEKLNPSFIAGTLLFFTDYNLSETSEQDLSTKLKKVSELCVKNQPTCDVSENPTSGKVSYTEKWLGYKFKTDVNLSNINFSSIRNGQACGMNITLEWKTSALKTAETTQISRTIKYTCPSTANPARVHAKP